MTAARSVHYALGEPSFREEFWKRRCIVREDKSSFDAVGDMFGENAVKYSMGCTDAARFVHLRAASVTLGKPTFDAAIGHDTYRNLRRVRYQWQNFSETDWFPGDWGYFDNPDQNKGYRAGENVIYLGGSEGLGCFEDSSPKFKANARFWGHGIGERTFQEMYDEVNGWDQSDAKVLDYRWSLRQPPLIP